MAQMGWSTQVISSIKLIHSSMDSYFLDIYILPHSQDLPEVPE